MSEGYNGWKNYETWVTALWFGNEYGDYLEIQELVAEIKEEYAPDGDEITDGVIDIGTILADKSDMQYALARKLEDHVNERISDALDNGNLGASLIADLVRAAMSEVNWSEWAENLLEE